MPFAARLSAFLPKAPEGASRGEGTGRIRDLYAALAAGDLLGLLTRLAPGVDWEEDRGGPDFSVRRIRRGRGAVARLFADPRGFPCALEIAHIVECEGEVAVLVLDGAPAESEDAPPPRIEAHLWTLGPDGLVTRFRQISGVCRPEAAALCH